MKNGRTIIKALSALTLLAILVAGFHPKNFSLTESITSKCDSGLLGGRYTLAATDRFLPANLVSDLNKNGFVIEMELTPAEDSKDYFKAVATITTGNDSDQFLIGQWSDTLIVMMGNDYPNKSRNPTLHIKPKQILGNESAPAPIRLKLVFAGDGASVFYEGQKVAANARFLGQLPGLPDENNSDTEKPEQTSEAFITLTNAANREHGWPGSITYFELLELGTANETSVASYDFTTAPVTTQSNLDNADIKLLANYQARKAELMSSTMKYFSKGRGSLIDILLNIAGFVPFGLLGFLLLYKFPSLLLPFMIICLAGSSLSVVIESVQSIIPSRHSSIFDVFFNSIGTLLGALFGLLLVAIKIFLQDKQMQNKQQAAKAGVA